MKLNRRVLFSVLLCMACVSATARQPFRVLEYNVENLFDCFHDSLKNDAEFLPGNLKGWTSVKYHDKLNKIARVILAASSGQVPDLVGLCEVENVRCVRDLVRHSPLRDAAYDFVVTDSPDERGIDVALLYQPAVFRLISARPIRISSAEIGRPPTRDILHVAGRVVTGDTLDIFLCHMPSRRGGEKASAPYRLFTAGVLRHAADSVMAVRRCPRVVIMGDFNDTPSSRSIAGVLGAVKPDKEVDDTCLYNLMNGKKEGTYRYRGEWCMLDQMIVNGLLLKTYGGIKRIYRGAQVVDFPFLLEEDEDYGGDMPFRTYRGMRYVGGYSDHLPLVLDLEIPEE